MRALWRGVAGGASSSSDAADDEPPHHLRCPITFVLFRDPVVTSAGHSYERGAVLAAWRAAGRRRDPTTNTAVDGSLVPNWNIRSQVQAWLDAHPGRVPEGWPDRRVPRLKPDGTPADGEAAFCVAPPPQPAPAPPAPARGGNRVVGDVLAGAALAYGAPLLGFTPLAAVPLTLLVLAVRHGAVQRAAAAWRAAQRRLAQARRAWEQRSLWLRVAACEVGVATLCFGALCIGCELLLLLLARTLLPPAALGGSAGSIATSVARWTLGCSWWRPVRWLQLGLYGWVERYTPGTSARAFGAQLLCVGPAWAAAGAAHGALAAARVPLLSAVAARSPTALLAALLVGAAAPSFAQWQAVQQGHVAVAPDRQPQNPPAWRARTTLLGCVFLPATLLVAPLCADAAAAACAPAPLRLVRHVFGAEAAAGAGVSALHAAARAGCGAVTVRALAPLPRAALNAADAAGDTAAVLAAARGDADALDALAEAGALLTALAPRGITPLHAAAAGNHVAAAEAVLQRAPTAVTARDAAGDTPLAHAVRAGAMAAAQLLLAYGADASPAALSGQHSSASLLVLALPAPELLDALVAARCASLASAALPAFAAAQLRDELSHAKGELRLHSPLLPDGAARVLARLSDGATRCDGDDE